MSERNGFENPYAHVLETGEESWVYPTVTPAGPAIRVQWLSFQGAEFEIRFADKGARDRAALALFTALAPDSERAIRGRSKFDLAREAGFQSGQAGWYDFLRAVEPRLEDAHKGEFRRADLTLTPDMVAAVLGPEARFAITPTSLKAREQFERLGIRAQYQEGLALTGAEVVEALEQAAAPAPGR